NTGNYNWLPVERSEGGEQRDSGQHPCGSQALLQPSVFFLEEFDRRCALREFAFDAQKATRMRRSGTGEFRSHHRLHGRVRSFFGTALCDLSCRRSPRVGTKGTLARTSRGVELREGPSLIP